MRIFKRFRFSLASLLLGMLTLCSGVLLWDKWPAWKMMKIWQLGDTSPIWPYDWLPDQHRHYLDRLAGLEMGDPEKVLQRPKPEHASRPSVLDSTDRFFLDTLKETPFERDGVNLYSRDSMEPIQTYHFNSPFYTAEFCYPKDGSHVALFSRGKSETTLTVLEAKSGVQILSAVEKEISPKQIFFTNNTWYALIDNSNKAEVWNLSTNRRERIPTKLIGSGGTELSEISLTLLEPDVVLVRGVVMRPYYSLWNLRNGTATACSPGTYFPAKREGYWVEGTEIHTYTLHGPQGPRPLGYIKSPNLTDFALSMDGKFLVGDAYTQEPKQDDSTIWVWNLETHEPPVALPTHEHFDCFSSDGNGIYSSVYGQHNYSYWRLQHPQTWYGIAYTLEFWLTLTLIILLALSIRRDFRALKA